MCIVGCVESSQSTFQVTGVFCQSAIDSAQNDHATVVQSILANKQMHVNKIRNLFTRFDQQETGVITFAPLAQILDAPVCTSASLRMAKTNM